MMIHLKHLYKQVEQNLIFVAVAVAAVIIIGALMLSKSGVGLKNIHVGGLLGGVYSNKQIAQKAVDYINNNKLSQTPASLSDKSITTESGLIKFKIKIGTNEFDSYASKDGKLFFPQAFQVK